MVTYEGKESQTYVISGIRTLYTIVEKTRCIVKGTGAQCTCISSVMALENVFDRISMSFPAIFYAKHIITIFINFASRISFDSFSVVSSSLNFKIFGRL